MLRKLRQYNDDRVRFEQALSEIQCKGAAMMSQYADLQIEHASMHTRRADDMEMELAGYAAE